MAVTFRSSTGAQSNGATSQSIAKPTGVVAADVLFAFHVSDDAAPTTVTGSTWTQLGTTGTATGLSGMKNWQRVVDGSEPASFTFNYGGAVDVAAGIIAVSGANTTTPLVATPGTSTGTGTSMAAPSVTGVVGGLLVCVWYIRGDATLRTATTPAGMTKRIDAQGDWATFAVATEPLSAAGATGERTATFPISTGWRAYSFVVQPPAPSTGTGAGSWAFAGTGSGKRAPRATGAGSWSFAGSGTGQATRSGSGSGTVAFTGSGAGTTTRRGNGTGTIAWTGSGTGSSPRRGSGTGAWSFVGAGTGATVRRGSGSGTATWTGGGTGTAPLVGVSDGSGGGSWAFAGSGGGRRSPVGQGAGGIAWAGSGSGTAPVVAVASGSGAGAWGFTGTGAGRVARTGSGTGTWTFTGRHDTRLRDITLHIGVGRSRTLTTTDITSRGLAAIGRSRTLTANPRE